MALQAVPFKPGLIKDSPEYSAQGFATDMQWVRWDGGFAKSRGGRTKYLTQQFQGTQRGELTWQTSLGVVSAAFGTNCKLYVSTYGFIANITPSRSTGTLGAGPIATTINDATVTITHAAHGALTGDTVFLGNATAVGGITLAPTGSIPAGAFTTKADSNVVTIAWTGHGFQTGWEIIISGSTAVGGITPDGTFLVKVIDSNYLQIYSATAASSNATGGGTPTYIARRPYTITVANANSYTIEADSQATATASGGGAAVQYLFEISCGRLYGSSGVGFGSAGYSTGGFGAASAGGVSPRDASVWCLQNYGDDLLASRIGTTIYEWMGNWSQRATALANAPAQVQWFIVTPNRTVMAFGCTNDAGDFDAMLIRYTDSEDREAWNITLTNNAGDLKLNYGSRLITAAVVLDNIYCWTDTTFAQVAFVGNFEQMYRDAPIGTGFGIVSPRAFAALGDSLMWMTPEANFVRFNGGAPVELPCQSKNWLKARLALGQNFKVFAFADAAFNEIAWGYATSATAEVAEYICVSIDAAASNPDGATGWSNGTFRRTGWVDVQEGFRNRISWDVDGYMYEEENGASDNGAAISRHVEWGPIGIDSGDRVMNVSAMVLDRTLTSGTLQAYLYFRRYPNGAVTTKGPYSFSSSVERVCLKGQGRQMGMRLFSGTNNDAWKSGIFRADITEGPRR